MSVKQIGPEQAHEILQKQSDVVYLDVRTEQEFQNGHVPKAVNIPVVLPDPSTRQMRPNPNFLPGVEAKFSKDQKLIVGCQAGGRSQYAAEILVQSGYKDVSNMQGGFGGARDPMGRIVAPGWTQLNLPIEK
ncbi:MAG: rhodanese-like domain-containing protein [Acidobacteria bacterium]|nr:rhodanese-like domain-containing protein [Acidobacteriota bacterium]